MGNKITRQWTCKLCGWANDKASKKCASCNKSKPRQKKGALPRSANVHECVILSLDTANVTGWSIRVGGSLVSHGEHKLYTDAGVAATHTMCDSLYSLGGVTGLPIVVASERSWGGYMGTGRTTAFGYWLHALRSIGVKMKRIVEVYPASWRAVVLAGAVEHGAKRDRIREVEMNIAHKVAGGQRELGADEAPAILIGLWAERAGEIGAVL